MKLLQNLKLLPDHSITTWLSQELRLEHSDVLLGGPFELSFHPFGLCAWASPDFFSPALISPPLSFTWHLNIIDDEEGKALINQSSKNRVLLMLSEVFTGLTECCASTGYTIESIEPELSTHMLALQLSTPQDANNKALIAGALCLRVALDSLLFCRGLLMKESLFVCQEQSPIAKQLQAIFLGHF